MRLACLALLAAGLALMAPGGTAHAAEGLGPAADLPSEARGVTVPNFWNVERRVERPDITSVPKVLRFLTADDYPPFNFTASDGTLAGFNVDLARAICAELEVTCTVLAVPFDTVTSALQQGQGDAAVAGLTATPGARAVLDFSERYLGTPARFVASTSNAHIKADPEVIATKRVGVVSRTAHEAYLRAFFNEAAIRPFTDLKSAQEALRKGEVDLIFGDGIALSLWLNGSDSAGCCTFVGGPFTESRFFGDGFAVAVKAGNDTLRAAINYALQRLWEKGTYTDLYLRWFPISFY